MRCDLIEISEKCADFAICPSELLGCVQYCTVHFVVIEACECDATQVNVFVLLSRL